MPPTTPLEDRYGRSQKKNIALAAWHAPLGGRTEEADLCRGLGFRRTAPSAPPRPEDRHVQGPAGAEKEGILIGFGDKARPPAASARIWPTSGPTVPSGQSDALPGDIPVILGRRDTHGRFSAASDSA